MFIIASAYEKRATNLDMSHKIGYLSKNQQMYLNNKLYKVSQIKNKKRLVYGLQTSSRG